MPAVRSAGIALALIAGAACADGVSDGLAEQGRPISLTAEPVALGAGELAPGVSVAGAWVLRSSDAAFGGISGLLVEAGRVTAVTDKGRWLTAQIAPESAPEIAFESTALLTGARIGRILDAGGAPLPPGHGTDAEGLARVNGQLRISFEQDHRIVRHLGAGRVGDAFRPRGAPQRLGANAGFEGLAALPNGRLLVIAESRIDDAFPYLVLGDGGVTVSGRLPALSKHDVTGADVGPDGRLYLLQRHYSVLTGVSIRLLRYALDPDGAPVPGSAHRLAAFDDASGIDNMEGVALAPGPGGAMLIWLIADDNFNPRQRNLLVALRLDP